MTWQGWAGVAFAVLAFLALVWVVVSTARALRQAQEDYERREHEYMRRFNDCQPASDHDEP